MKKIAVLFAGQGAQYPGMGKSLYESSEAARGVFDVAERMMGGLKQLCFEGDAEALSLTRNTQPAVLITDLAAYAALRESGITPYAVAGFSLGEYAALCASGAMTQAQTLAVVHFRADAMDRVQGGMAAILGVDASVVETLCAETAAEPVNYNCPGQTVVAGTLEALEALEPLAKAQGAKVVRLSVSCPSHSSMMRGVGEMLAARLDAEPMGRLEIPLVANVTGEWAHEGELKALMARQVMSPVRWEKSMRTLIAGGFTHFVEVGPGKTLAGFLKRIDRALPVYSVQDAASLQEAVEALAC